MSISNAFNIGVSGLKAAQLALDATAHNVANANTPFFARNVVDFNEQRFSAVGNGVIANISTADAMLPANVGNQISDTAAEKAKAELLDKLGGALQAANIPKTMTDFFNSWSDLASDPSSDITREAVVQKTTAVTQSFNGFQTATQDITQQAAYDNRIDTQQFNGLLNSLAQINGSSIDANTGQGQRQDILNKLNALASVTSPDGGNTLYLRTATGQGKQILAGSTSSPLSVADLSAAVGGSIGGRSSVLAKDASQMVSQLSTELEPVLNQINTQHKAGLDKNGVPGKDLFTFTPGQVFNMAPTSLSRAQVAASSTAVTATNGENANAMYAFGHQGGIDAAQSVGAMEAKIEGQSNQANNMAGLYGASADSTLSRWNDQFGVNLDEEAVNAMKYQRMYEASAKLIKTADEMLGTLLSIKA